MKKINYLDELKKDIESEGAKNGRPEHYNFIVWFLRMYGFEDNSIDNSIVDKAGDKGNDAIFVNHVSKTILILQSKYSSNFGGKKIVKSEVLDLIDNAKKFNNKNDFKVLIKNSNVETRNLLNLAADKYNRDNYDIHLEFISTHNKLDKDETKYLTKLAEDLDRCTLFIRDIKELELLYMEYLQENTPRLGKIEIGLEDSMMLNLSNKLDKQILGGKASICLFSLADIEYAFRNYADELFNKNLRIFISDKPITNKTIKKTLSDNEESKKFILYNNGGTILCDRYEQRDNKIIMWNPQIINGCQTVTSILKEGQGAKNSYMLFKLIETKDIKLIDNITFYSNLSNKLYPRDYFSGEKNQVRLKRDFGKNYNVYFNIKRGAEYNRLKKTIQKRYKMEIKNIDLTKIILASVENPALAMSSNESVVFVLTEFKDKNKFEKSYYHKIFNANANAKSYLSKFLLFTLLEYESKKIYEKTSNKHQKSIGVIGNSDRKKILFYLLHYLCNYNYDTYSLNKQLFGLFSDKDDSMNSKDKKENLKKLNSLAKKISPIIDEFDKLVTDSMKSYPFNKTVTRFDSRLQKPGFFKKFDSANSEKIEKIIDKFFNLLIN